MVDLDALARAVVADGRAPAVALGLLRDGTRVVATAGVLERVAGGEVTAQTPFHVASLTKPAVATLALTLVADGAVALDEPVVSYLPQLRATWPGGRDVTLRHCLSHRSGLQPDLERMERFGDGDDALDAAVEEVCARRMRTRPGQTWRYANSGFWIAGSLAAHVLGTTFEAAMDERVLRPLGMGASGFEPPPETAAGHEHMHGPGSRPPYPRARRASGGLVSSAGDALALGSVYAGRDGPRLLPPTLVAEVAQPLALSTWGIRWGLGWALEPDRGTTIVCHDGNWSGYRARLAVVPDRGIAFAALANGGDARLNLHGIERAVLRETCGIEPPSLAGRLPVMGRAVARDLAALARARV
jgi:CubicO group peptidase (beta-lactamase class C family)